jgi:lipopolysaccharide export system protein LptA
MSANTMKAQLLGQDKVTRLLGRVEIVHGSTVLRGDSAWVSTLRQQAEVWGRVSLTDRDIQMTGRRACYYKKIGKAVMHGDPVAKDQQWTLSADSLAYFRETSRSEAYGNVRIADSSGRQQARADFGQYWHQKGYGMLDGSPKLEIREGQGATVRTITSHKMEVYRQGNLAIAKGEVRFVQDSLTVPSPNVGSMGTPSNSGLQASCGLAAYYRDQGRLVLEERPRVWQPGAEMEARVMTLSLNGDTVKSLEAFDSVALRQFTATDEDTDLIRCDSLWAEFQDGRISQAKTCGDVWSLYHQFDQGRKRGSNIVQSRVMEFYFKEGRLARINIPAEARGAFFGEEVP